MARDENVPGRRVLRLSSVHSKLKTPVNTIVLSTGVIAASLAIRGPHSTALAT